MEPRGASLVGHAAATGGNRLPRVAGSSRYSVTALTLYAVGAAGSLADASAALAPDTSAATCDEPSPEEVTTYRQWRSGVEETYERLVPAVALFAGSRVPAR